jgi:replicative DNA helicase
MIKGVDDIRAVFMKRYGETAARLASNPPGLTDPSEKRSLLETLMKPTVEEAVRAGYSHNDIAREMFRHYKNAGCPIEAKQAIAKVTSYAARICAGMPIGDEFDEDFFLFSNAARSLRSRLRQVSGWSLDSAFLFGIPCLDELTGGVQPGEMMALSGAQGSMKTSLLLSGIEDALSRGMSVQFFSLDMTPGEIQERRIQRRIRCGQYELHRLIREGAREIAEAESEINDLDANLLDIYGNDGAKPDLTVDDVAELAKIKMPNVLCIDYLTLLRRQNQDDLQCVNEAMPKLKKLTQLLGIRTVLLSQMSRASKREQQSGVIGGHAKGGGIVEEMAHSEIELFKDAPLGSEPCPIIASVTKNRRGPSGRSYRLYYEAACMLFTGEYVRVERAGKSMQKRAFQSPETVGEVLPGAHGMARADTGC